MLYKSQKISVIINRERLVLTDKNVDKTTVMKFTVCGEEGFRMQYDLLSQKLITVFKEKSFRTQ